MNGFLIKSALAVALLVLEGCLWVDEDVPDQIVVKPIEYEPSLVTPEAVGGFEGYRLPTTAVIRSFLGGRDFRIAVTLSDGSFGVFVLEPAEPDQPPRIRRYSRGGESSDGGKTSWYGNCALSPDGNRLAYSLHGSGDANVLPVIWMLELGSELVRRVPLFSRGNSSYGMYGERPYWHEAGGRSFVGFLGGSLQGSDETFWPLLVGGREAQMVEVLPDSALSQVFPVRVGGERIPEDVRGISRDSQWVMIRRSGGQSYLLPAARAAELSASRTSDSTPAYFAGNGASLNPFDSGSTRHSDFYAVPAFKVPASNGTMQDTLSDPRTLDGRRITSIHPLAADNFWVCDADRRIHFSRRVGPGTLDRVVWTSHPNFVLALESVPGMYLVRLAGSKEEVLDGGEDATRRADGVLSLFTADMATWTGKAVQDISMWIQP